MTLKRYAMIAACMLGLTTLSACNADEAGKSKEAVKTEAGAVMATVNGTPIPQARADLLLKKRVEQGQADTPQLKQSVRDSLIHRELIIQEALKKGLDKSPEVAIQIDMAKQDVLVNAFVQDFLKNNPVSDDAVKAEYEKIKEQRGDKEYKARHILVDKEADAKEIIAQLKKGAKFEKLAEKSKDPSKSAGGDLGWSPASAYVKPFADAMVALKKGEYTKEPVQSQFGWHVIRLDDIRSMPAPPLEQIKPQLAQHMQQQMVEKAITDLRAKAKVE